MPAVVAAVVDAVVLEIRAAAVDEVVSAVGAEVSVAAEGEASVALGVVAWVSAVVAKTRKSLSIRKIHSAIIKQ